MIKAEKHKKMDKLDILIKQKIFFKMIYGNLVGEGNNLQEGNYIRVFQAKDNNNIINFFNNIDDLVKYTTNKRYGVNTYFTLATTNSKSGTEKDLRYRTVLGFDFDKKDLGADFNYKDVLERFKSLGLWYHVLLDSGHGYHAYMCIEQTQDLQKVQEVQKALCKLLGADLNALKSTQVLRVPYTFNVKDKSKQVNIIQMFKRDTIKRYDINKLYNRFCCNTKDKDIGDRATQYTLNSTNIPMCIQNIINNGSAEGTRYEDLQKIVVSLRDRNKTLTDIKQVCKEWAYKSGYNDSLDSRIDNIYNNRKYISMDCKGCKHSHECWNRIESDFNYPNEFNLLEMTESHTRYLKPSKRKGVKVMEGNDLLIYGILKNHADGLYRAEIEKELTYRNTICLSKPTLTKTLKSLENNDFIEVTTEGKKKFYKLKDIRSKIELKYNISYAATYECVKGNISTDELRLYNYMRYLHNKQQRENPKGLKGNLFQFNQSDLAKDLGLTQGRISQMISNLLFEKLLSVWYRQPSQNNGFDFYIYKLNY